MLYTPRQSSKCMLYVCSLLRVLIVMTCFCEDPYAMCNVHNVSVMTLYLFLLLPYYFLHRYGVWSVTYPYIPSHNH